MLIRGSQSWSFCSVVSTYSSFGPILSAASDYKSSGIDSTLKRSEIQPSFVTLGQQKCGKETHSPLLAGSVLKISYSEMSSARRRCQVSQKFFLRTLSAPAPKLPREFPPRSFFRSKNRDTESPKIHSFKHDIERQQKNEMTDIKSLIPLIFFPRKTTTIYTTHTAQQWTMTQARALFRPSSHVNHISSSKTQRKHLPAVLVLSTSWKFGVEYVEEFYLAQNSFCISESVAQSLNNHKT
ncbi:hypothetical protein TSAR_004904, partial [Trichomalopsis sarcophagae]